MFIKAINSFFMYSCETQEQCGMLIVMILQSLCIVTFFQMSTEMMRLQATTTPLVSAFKTGLAKYSKAIIVKGKGVKKPPQCFLEALAMISAQRGEGERQGMFFSILMKVLEVIL